MVTGHVVSTPFQLWVSLWVLCTCFCLQVLTVLCNVAEKGPAYCQHLWPGLLLPTLLDTLALSDTEVVGQSLELLQLLFLRVYQGCLLLQLLSLRSGQVWSHPHPEMTLGQ